MGEGRIWRAARDKEIMHRNQFQPARNRDKFKYDYRFPPHNL